MIGRSIFNDLGRFDEALAPAYYEETDFCIRLRKSGLRVLYEPDAVVFHFEFGSALSTLHVSEQSQRNRSLICAKHADFLRTREENDPKNVLRARDARPDAMRLLVIDDKVPHRWRGAGFPRAHELIRTIETVLNNVSITMLTTDETSRDWTAIRQTLSARIEVAFAQTSEAFSEFMRDRKGIFDTILVSRPHNASKLNQIVDADPGFLENTRVIYDAEALFAYREIVEKQLNGASFSEEEKERIVEAEISLARHADTVLAVSNSEANEFRRRLDTDVKVLGHSLRTIDTRADFAVRSGILFVGVIQTDASPNGDSLLWFFRTVWPKILRLAPHPIPVSIAGQNFSSLVTSECPEGIKLLGRVEDLAPFYESSRAFIAPTRFAAGVPHKVHEASAYGLPSVVSPIIQSQLDWRDGEEVLVGRDSESFAQACVLLHENEEIWQKVRAGALSAVKRDCNPANFLATIRDVFLKQTP